MSWFEEKIIDKITHRRELETKILDVEKSCGQLAERVSILLDKTSDDSRLVVLEKDRDELYARLDKIQEQLAVLERNDKDRVGILERDRDELYARIDKIQDRLTALGRGDEDRVSTLEHDRDELYVRMDKMQNQLATQDENNDKRVNVLEHDRDELFQRYDDLVCKLDQFSDEHRTEKRLDVLEKDRDELFQRCDALLERLNRATRSSKEENQVATYILRKEMLQPSALIGSEKNNKARIHFVRCLDIYNTGDMNCGPELYFEELMKDRIAFFHSIKEIDYSLIRENDWVILGGGGMLDCSPQYQEAIKQLLVCSKRVVSWGLGHNAHHKDTIYYHGEIEPIDYTQFFLFTTRDYGYGTDRFCPCVSCMMEGLSRDYVIKRRIGVLTHHEIRISEFDFDTCDNSQPIEKILQFIGESEIIIANTYHGAYWATLMNKKVILYHPFSNKFDYFKYPLVQYSGDLETDIDRALVYPHALQECRELNLSLMKELISHMHATEKAD